MLQFSGNNPNIKMFGVPPEHCAIGYVYNDNLPLGNIALQYVIQNNCRKVWWCFLMISFTFWRSRRKLSNSPKLSCGFKVFQYGYFKNGSTTCRLKDENYCLWKLKTEHLCDSSFFQKEGVREVMTSLKGRISQLKSKPRRRCGITRYETHDKDILGKVGTYRVFHYFKWTTH